LCLWCQSQSLDYTTVRCRKLRKLAYRLQTHKHTCDSTSCKTNTLQPIFTAVMHLRQAVNRLARTRIIRCKMVRPNITRQYPKWFGLKTSLSLSLLYGVSNLALQNRRDLFVLWASCAISMSFKLSIILISETFSVDGTKICSALADNVVSASSQNFPFPAIYPSVVSTTPMDLAVVK